MSDRNLEQKLKALRVRIAAGELPRLANRSDADLLVLLQKVDGTYSQDSSFS